MRIEPKKIMCAIDFSEFTELTLTYGRSLAAEFDARLYLCHVVAKTVMVSSHMPAYVDYIDIENERISAVRDNLETMAQEFGIECEIIVTAGHPADEIEEIAREHQIDMVIAATHGGSGVKRFLIGSVTNRLVKTLSCPLLVLHAGENKAISKDRDPVKLKRILVGCDFSPDSKLAFDTALSLAQEFQTQLYLAHVVRPAKPAELTTPDYIKLQEGDFSGWNRSQYLELQKKAEEEDPAQKSTRLSRIERQLASMVPEDCRNWCTPITILLEGRPYKELIKYAEKNEIDMIVLGIRGHSLLEQFLVGSTTDRVISRASCPVLAVRHTI
jgi:nucleotide-binding universal stress UspA family protein